METEIQKTNQIDLDTSRAITGVRFLLIVFVVFIHNVITYVNFADGVVNVEVPVAVDFIRTLISNIFGSTAVPTFFFISGYLLFFKNERYGVLLKKKCKAILLPYILWIVINIFAFSVCQQIQALRQYFANIIIKELDFKGWIGLFAGRDMESAKGLFVPLVYQFWFLRELFFCVLISPVIKKMIDKLPLFFAVFLLLMINSNWFYGAFRTALFYFSLGCFAVRFNLTYKNLEKIKFTDIGFLYIFILALVLYFYFSGKTGFAGIGTLSIITGGLLLLKISGVVSRNEKVFSVLKYLAGFSFWLYATHDPFLIGPIKKLWTRFLPINGYWLIAEYFGAVILTIAISLGAGILVKKTMPKVFSILTGGR